MLLATSHRHRGATTIAKAAAVLCAVVALSGATAVAADASGASTRHSYPSEIVTVPEDTANYPVPGLACAAGTPFLYDHVYAVGLDVAKGVEVDPPAGVVVHLTHTTTTRLDQFAWAGGLAAPSANHANTVTNTTDSAQKVTITLNCSNGDGYDSTN